MKNARKFTLVSVLAAGLILGIFACNESAKAKVNLVHKDAPHPGVLAKINGEDITEDALVGDDKLDFFDLKKREYELKMDRLNKLIVDKLVGAEAKKAGMPLSDFIDKKVAGGDIKISDKDYKKFVADKHIPEAQINPQIKERIMAYLQSQKKQELTDAYVAKLTKNNPVEVYFNKPKMVVAVEAGQAPAFGTNGAPIEVIEFSDFQCPYCARGADTVHELKKKYGSKVRFAFRQFPLPMHKDARGAAEASMCINDQGSDKFWKFHDLAFKNQDKLDSGGLEKLAKDSGANVDKFKECVTGKKFSQYVQTDLEYGEKIGVKSTPTFFVNGQLVSGALPIESFAEIIDDELDSKTKKN
jgi:protein-disulfide isomerase